MCLISLKVYFWRKSLQMLLTNLILIVATFQHFCWDRNVTIYIYIMMLAMQQIYAYLDVSNATNFAEGKMDFPIVPIDKFNYFFISCVWSSRCSRCHLRVSYYTYF